jgi:hypothetical protein
MIKFLNCIIFISIYSFQFADSACFSQAAHSQEISDLLNVKNFIDSIYNKCPAYTKPLQFITTTFETISSCQKNSDCDSNLVCCDQKCKSITI